MEQLLLGVPIVLEYCSGHSLSLSTLEYTPQGLVQALALLTAHLLDSSQAFTSSGSLRATSEFRKRGHGWPRSLSWNEFSALEGFRQGLSCDLPLVELSMTDHPGLGYEDSTRETAPTWHWGFQQLCPNDSSSFLPP